MHLKQGTVQIINSKDCTAKVVLPDLDNMLSPWLQIVYDLSFGDMDYHMPKIGTQVACILDDNFESGVIIGATYSKKNLPPASTENKFIKQFEDCTIVEYDKNLKTLTLSSAGNINLISADMLNITAPIINITGELAISGSMALNGKSVDGHTHTNPEGGITGKF